MQVTSKRKLTNLETKSVSYWTQARDRFLATATPVARPAVTLVEVSRLFSDELMIEIEAIAAR